MFYDTDLLWDEESRTRRQRPIDVSLVQNIILSIVNRVMRAVARTMDINPNEMFG